jgi:RNA polymerase sigma-70 factor (ECF subfamily)
MATISLYHQSFSRLEEERKIVEKSKLNPEHFGILYTRYNDSILRYILKRVQDIDAAYDLTSQVFIKALTALDKFEFRGVPFSSWLFRIAKSEVYQFFRDQKKNSSISIDTLKLSQMIEECEDEYNEEERANLLKALNALGADHLKLIDLRYFEKRSFKEIGEILNITENNAKVKTFRTVLKLKKIIGKS